MIVLTAIQARYTGFSPKSSEEFNSASRSVKPGLIASGIVSAWTWAATLVTSSLQSYMHQLTSIYAVAIQCSGLQVRDLWPVVVWCWGYCPGALVCTGESRDVTSVLQYPLIIIILHFDSSQRS